MAAMPSQHQLQCDALRILLASGAISPETARHPRYPNGESVNDETVDRLCALDHIDGGLRDALGTPRKRRWWLTPEGVELALSLVVAARGAGACSSFGTPRGWQKAGGGLGGAKCRVQRSAGHAH
jgi:hypothetical protein